MSRLQLHVLTDPRYPVCADPEAFARLAFQAGADAVQLRDKTRSAAELNELARRMAVSAREVGGLLVVNDHVDLAREVGSGLHLGPEDTPVAEARRRFTGWLGVSARDPGRAAAVVRDGADYLGVGPVFGTRSKDDAPGTLGLEGLAAVASAVDAPVIGIGGVDATNAADVIRAGAAGVAVLSAVLAARDPGRAIAEVRAALDAVEGELARGAARC